MLPLTNRIGVIVAAPEYERIVPSLDLDPVYSEVKSASMIYGSITGNLTLDEWDPQLYETLNNPL